MSDPVSVIVVSVIVVVDIQHLVGHWLVVHVNDDQMSGCIELIGSYSKPLLYCFTR